MDATDQKRQTTTRRRRYVTVIAWTFMAFLFGLPARAQAPAIRHFDAPVCEQVTDGLPSAKGPIPADSSNVVVFKKSDRADIAARAVLYSGLAFDVATTEIMLRDGGREWNPMLGQNPYQRIAVSAGTIIGVDFISRWMRRNGHERLAIFVNFFAGGIRFGAGAYNLSQRDQ